MSDIWKKHWRDNEAFPWMDDEKHSIEFCIAVLGAYVDDCADKDCDTDELSHAESTIEELENILSDRDEYPDWPTKCDVAEYCGYYRDLDEERHFLSSDILEDRYSSPCDLESWLRGMLCLKKEQIS